MTPHDVLHAVAADGVQLVVWEGRLHARPPGRIRPETLALVRAHIDELRALAADPWADCADAFRLGRLHQCRACRHFADVVPPDGDDLGVQGAGWCRRFNVAAHPLTPFCCDGYVARTH